MLCCLNERTGYTTVFEMKSTLMLTGARTLQTLRQSNWRMCVVFSITNTKCYQRCCVFIHKILSEVDLNSPDYLVPPILIDRCTAVQMSRSGQAILFLSAIEFSVTHTT